FAGEAGGQRQAAVEPVGDERELAAEVAVARRALERAVKPGRAAGKDRDRSRKAAARTRDIDAGAGAERYVARVGGEADVTRRRILDEIADGDAGAGGGEPRISRHGEVPVFPLEPRGAAEGDERAAGVDGAAGQAQDAADDRGVERGRRARPLRERERAGRGQRLRARGPGEDERRRER